MNRSVLPSLLRGDQKAYVTVKTGGSKSQRHFFAIVFKFLCAGCLTISRSCFVFSSVSAVVA